MEIVEHLESLESLINEYQERAGRDKKIPAEIHEYTKRHARQTLRRVLIDSDTAPQLYDQSDCTALSDRVWTALRKCF